jgi:hypothetical protein
MPGTPPKYNLPVSSFKDYKRSKTKDTLLKIHPWQKSNVNPSARVYPYSYTPKVSKYAFAQRMPSNDLLGVAGLGFPRKGIDLTLVGIKPLENNPDYKGSLTGQVSKKLGNFNIGASVNFSKDKRKRDPRLNIKYNFKNGGAMAPIIPTWDYPSEKTFVKDTTALPFKEGGFIKSLKNHIRNSRKYVNGGFKDPLKEGTTNFLELKKAVNAPIPSRSDELTRQYGWDYKKTYNESGTPHYYTKKQGADNWIDLESKGNENSLAAAKALAWGDDTSYIGTPQHLAQRQEEYDKQLKSKGEWLGPMEAGERKKLYNIESDKEAPNMILSYAQDSDFINSIANFNLISPGNVNEKYNDQIKRALLKGTHGFNPATGQLIKLSGLGEAGQSRVVDTKSLDDPYLNYTLEGVEGEMKDPNFYDKRYKKEQKVAHKDLTDYINKRHLVHLDKSDAWRGHMGSYPIFAEDVYKDDEGNVIFNDQTGMQKRLTGDPVDLYNYGNRDVYMTDAEEEAYRKAMLQENTRVVQDSPIWNLPGMIYGFGAGSLIRQGAKQGLKQFAKKQSVQAAKQVLKQPLLTNTAPKFSKYMLNPMQLLDVAGGIYGVDQFTDPTSMTRQSIKDYQQGKGSFGDAAFNVAMSGLSALPVGSEILRAGYGNIAGGVNAVRRIPQVRDFVPGMGQVLKGEAKFKDLLTTQKYSRFTKPGQAGSSKDRLWYQKASAEDIDKYKPGSDKVTDLILSDARASRYNVGNIQNRLTGTIKDNPLDVIASSRSIAPFNDPRMISYVNKIQDPAKRELFKTVLKNPDKYWELPGYTDEMAELVAKAPANTDELNLSKKLFSDIKAYDAAKWKPDYSLLNEFSGTYGFGKRQALKQGKKFFDYLSKSSSKLGKINKGEQAVLDATTNDD